MPEEMPDARFNRSRPTHVYKLHAGEPIRAEQIPETVLPDIFTKHPETGWEPRLETLYKLIDCTCVDVRDLPGVGWLWFDDEGKLKADFEANPIATALYHASYKTCDPIAGHAVLVLRPGVGAPFLSECLTSAFRERALFAAGRAFREGVDAPTALKTAREAHADEDYARAAVFYALAAHVYQGAPEHDADYARARKAFQISVENLAAHALTFGEGW